MSSTTSLPYEWLTRIPKALIKPDTIPLLGFPPEFPWEKFSDELKGQFQLSTLKIVPEKPNWQQPEEFLDGIGDAPAILHLTIPSFEGSLWWIMPQQNLAILISLLITKKVQPLEALEPDFLNSFYHFIALEAIETLGHLEFDQTLIPQIQSDQQLPQESSLAIGINTTIGRRKIWGKLLISQTLRSSIERKYAKNAAELVSSSPLSNQLDVTIHLEIGKTSINKNEWKKISPGDFILLDSCSFMPEEQKGRIMLTVNGAPLFRARLKKDKVKILEYPLYREVNTMADDEENTELTDESEFSEFEETELDEETAEEEETEAEEPDEIYEEETESEELLKRSKIARAKPSAFEEEVPDSGMFDVKLKENKLEGSMTSPENVPLPVVVEIGRLQMTIKKLMEIQPGNILDLNLLPESSVDLVVHGKRIARGELLRVGDTLGVRILDKG